MKAVPFLLILIGGLFTQGMLLSATAQVTSDGTTNTTINSNGNNFTILNGSEQGSNLFHSFREFSVPTGGSASFDLSNTPNITTIFSRVTGGNISNIDGLISTVNSSNPVNLFLLNPAGILFRGNAKLNIGGSFVGSTANSIKFADGAEFGNPSTSHAPLLTLSVPIGLQFGTNPKPIQVEGTGHNLTLLNPLNPSNSPINPQSHLTGLQLGVQPGKTLALIGGNIDLVGGTLEAIGGRIEIGGVGSGIVSLNPVNAGWTFSYDSVQSFRDIRFSQKALVDASGFSRGAIQIQGANISLIDGSTALIQNLGSQSSAGINIRASELFESIGVDPGSLINSGLRNETLAVGDNGDITITTKQLVLEGGARINSITYGSGKSGNISLEVVDSLKVLGFAPISGSSSVISTATYSSGHTEDINISTRQLTILNGGIIGAASLGSGTAGNVAITATELIELSGFMPGLLIPSSISSPSLFSGNAGNVIINTKRLIVSNGGRIDSSITGSGRGGNLTINATDSIEVKGTVPGSRNPSLISASASLLDESLRIQYGLSPAPTGDSGSLTINTGKLTVTDGALINVQNEGSGNGGELSINADSIFLSDRGSITASAKSGEGGNLNLQVQDIVVMQRNSQISAESGGIGNGGNITIHAPFIIGQENSDIIANAVQGRGGNINITTESIFGLEFRDRVTPENDITASSKFGVNGMVQINNIGLDPSSGLVELPVNLVDSSQQIATGCSDNTGNSFVVTGRGGIPQNPNQQVMSEHTWSDIRDLSAYWKNSELTAQIPTSSDIMEATSWRRNADGNIELVANTPARVQPSLTCAAVPQS